uniref:protein-serine/threonine phosphatase n=1 Tax=Kalanchoe fedtschenkoi TaxID=63787 RepID=A0A7N1A2X3_KALFE
MGNGIGKISVCFSGETRRSQSMAGYVTEPLDEGLGHSFCYVRPDPTRLSSSKVHSEEAATVTATMNTFRSISGASVSANASTPLSTSVVDLYSYGGADRSAAAFDCSTSFASIPLQPIPRNLIGSGPIGMIRTSSGPLERGFLSGPIERGFMSGPIEPAMFSGPMEKTSTAAMTSDQQQFHRSFSHGGFGFKSRVKKVSLIRVLQRAISRKMRLSRGQKSMIAPISKLKESDWVVGSGRRAENGPAVSSDGSLCDEDSTSNLQWAQGKAGEDRVHVVVSEEHGWVFVGIYDGFNGPDAPDYLLSNLYSAVHKELEGLLWGFDSFEPGHANPVDNMQNFIDASDEMRESCSRCAEQEAYPKHTRRYGRKSNGSVAKKWEESQQWWRCEWDRERPELDRKLTQQLNRSNSNSSAGSKTINHSAVLKALSEALRKTEEAYLAVADKMLVENPELALMGSCVLVMLMKGEDVYVMNVGDSRAVLGQKAEPDDWLGTISQDLERINEETLCELDASSGDRSSMVSSLSACQLTVDHSTNVEQEVIRIRSEHPDDSCAVMNERVKGSLKVTRAFGAGFLKQPRWNNALLEMFRIDYIGNTPYLTCQPSLHHHKLGAKDRFLILSSDGLYQYFTNEEAVSEVELFIILQPDGDPAQHLVEEVLFRAAKRAGMDFHELLEIPQGDRRRYHDDVSIIVISLEGRIWRSCV